jgi:hypothetical protein
MNIWMYWDKNPTPLINKIRKHNESILPIIFLDSISVKKYIPTFPPNFNTLIPQHQSDWIRLYLLVHYGGIWSDASIIYYEPKKVYELWEKTKTYDYVGFYRDKVIIDNWFIASKKGGKIITLWLKEYEKAIQEGFYEYRARLLSEGTNLDVFYPKGIPKDIYLINYICIYKVLQNINEKIYLLDSYKEMLSMSLKCFKHYKTKKGKTCMLKTKKVPYLKLCQHSRKEIERTGLELKLQ